MGNNIKMDLKKDWEDLAWIQLVQDRTSDVSSKRGKEPSSFNRRWENT
jgi:hypothetical protein